MKLTFNIDSGMIKSTKQLKAVARSVIVDFFIPTSVGVRNQNILNMVQCRSLRSLVEPRHSQNSVLTKNCKGGLMKVLTFKGHTLTAIQRNNNLFLTAKELAKGLGYNDDRSVNRIYSRHSDEFTPDMTGVVNLTTPKGGLQKTLTFAPRGCHLIAMFAKTPFAKEFRKWVLDVLEKEALTKQPAQSQPSLFEEKPESKPRQVKVSLPEAKEVKEAVESYGRKCYTFGILQEMMDSGKLVKTADGKIEFYPEGR